MNRKYLITPALGMFLFLNLEAVADLVNFPTGPAAWTVNVTPSQISPSSASAPTAQSHIVRINVAQDAEKRRSLVTWSDGKTIEQWAVPKMNLFVAEDSKGQAFSVLGGTLAARIIEIPFDSSAFSWIKPELLQEKNPISYQGKQCFHYRSGREEAWIDSQTQLPVALDDGTRLGVFTYQKDPPPALTLPAKFQDAFTRFEEGMGVVKPVYLPTH